MARPTSPSPSTMLNTPAGAPHSWMIAASAWAMAGVGDAGWSTTVSPNASAGAAFQAGMAIGKFHGVINPNTPSASLGRDVDIGRVDFERLAVAAQRLSSEILEDARRAHHFTCAFGQRLAFFAGKQDAQILRPRHDRGAHLVQQV